MIESLEPVLIMNFLRCSEVDSGVTELECLRSRSKREWTGRIDSVTIRENVLDDDRGCGRGPRAIRVDHGHALDRGEPELPVVRLPRHRLRTAIALAALHAIGSSVPDARDFRQKSLGKIIELLTGNAEDSFVATHPEIAVAIFQNGEDAVIEKAFTRGDRCPTPGFVAAQSSAGRADPERACAVLMKSENEIAGQSVALGEGGDGFTDNAVETSILSAGPDRAIAVFVNHADRFPGEFERIGRQCPVHDALKSARHSDPQNAAAIFIQRQHKIAI